MKTFFFLPLYRFQTVDHDRRVEAIQGIEDFALGTLENFLFFFSLLQTWTEEATAETKRTGTGDGRKY